MCLPNNPVVLGNVPSINNSIGLPTYTAACAYQIRLHMVLSLKPVRRENRTCS